MIEVDLPGLNLVLHQALGRGFEPAAVHPNPAVGPDPFGAHAMLAFRVLENHLRTVGISAFDPVARRSIPDAGLGELSVNRVDLHGAGVFGAQSPLRDVAMMADPVHELAAAVIHLPAPVPVRAVLRIRRPGRGPAPEVVVKLRRRIGEGSVAAGAARGQADFHRMHLADSPIAHQLAGEAEIPRGPLPRAGLPDAPVLGHSRNHSPALPQIMAERLLPINILTRPKGRNGGNGVPMVRRGHRNHINVVPGHQLAKILVAGAVLVVVLRVDPLAGALTSIAVHIVNRQHLAARIAQEPTQIAVAHAAQPDTPDRDAVARCRTPGSSQHRGWHHRGQAGDCPQQRSTPQKAAAAEGILRARNRVTFR